LDEADAMTNDAQNALRRTMEQFSGVTRFCLICNYVSRIIEPIASRCAKFRFRPLKEDLIGDRLRLIAKTEKVVCSDEVITRLTQVSGGDLRKAITFLQSSHRLFGALPSGVTTQHIDDIAGIIPDSKITELFQVIRGCDFQKLQRYVEDLIADGFPIAVLLGQLNDEMVKASNSAADVLGPLDGVAKAHISDCIAQADKALIDGADETLQLMAVAGFIMRVIQTDGKADLPKTSISV
jgi:replication factor C subunit 2/4